MKNEIVKLGAILFMFTAISAGIISFSNNVTAELIMQVEEAASLGPEVAKIVVPGSVGFENGDEILIEEIKKINSKFIDLKIAVDEQGNNVGYGIRTGSTVKGYGGDIELFVGISEEGEVLGIKLLKMTETPGLGTNVDKPKFKEQFFGKSLNNEFNIVKGAGSKPEDIISVAGATYSSRSFTSSVNNALSVYRNFIKK